MGAGCSSFGGKAGEPLHLSEFPPRPAYLACDLVGPPVIEYVRIGRVDVFIGQAAQFANAVCSLSDSLNELLLDVRLATGLLQGGFSILLSPSPNVDVFTVELLAAEGRPLEVAEAARLRGQDLTGCGKLAAHDAQLAQCLEDLADTFVSKVGVTASSLALSSSGTLVPRTPDQPVEPVVDEFNRAIHDMRTTLGADYLLALHIHKAQAHGMPAFRVKLLKPAPVQEPAACTASAARSSPPGPAGPGSSPPLGMTPPGFLPATLLDQSACLNASRLADARHAFQAANGRLAAVLKRTGLTCPLAVAPISPRTVGLAGCTTKLGQPAAKLIEPTAVATAAAAAAAAVRRLPASACRLVARAVEGLNGAIHSLAHAASAAPGPASFAALLTYVLGELRDVVAAAGGEQALESYQPTVHFRGGPDQTPSLEFSLDPQLDASGLWSTEREEEGDGRSRSGGGGGGGKERPDVALLFPDCLSPQVRRAWMLLQELVRVHNSAVAQLDSFRKLAATFEDEFRRRSVTLPHDALTARMSTAEATEAGQVLHRNHVELRDCWQGALQALTSTALLVRDEMAEAAQLARVQCSFMSPTAWSISVASSSAAATMTTSRTSFAAGSSLTSSMALSNITAASGAGRALSPMAPTGGATCSANTSPARASGLHSGGGGGGASIRSRGGGSALKNLADSFAAADTATEEPLLPGSPCNRLASSHDRQQQPLDGQRSRSVMTAGTQSPWRLRPDAQSTAAVADGVGVGASRGSPSRPTSRAVSMTAPGGSRRIKRSNTATWVGGRLGIGNWELRVGWVSVDGVADRGAGSGGGGGDEGGAPHTGQPPAAVAPAGRGGRVGGESLAEEYARTALAHLRLQDL